jgi:hypothetical protein
MSAAVAFGPTANPDAYVPWTGSERALAELTRWARGAGPPLCVLSGPPGMGKTLLLKLLAARTRERLRSLYLAYPDCDRAALCAFVLQGLDLGALDDSAESLLEALRTNAGPPVLLLIDEGELLPLDTVACLREVAAGAAGKLRVAIAVTREERRDELLAALGEDAQSVAIEGAMSKAEVAAHVRTQLSRAAIDPKIGERFDGATLARLHASSEGHSGVAAESRGGAALRGAARARRDPHRAAGRTRGAARRRGAEGARGRETLRRADRHPDPSDAAAAGSGAQGARRDLRARHGASGSPAVSRWRSSARGCWRSARHGPP